MLAQSLILIASGILGQGEEMKPRLEIAISETRERYTDFDKVYIEVFLVSDLPAHFVSFCINSDSDYGFLGQFEPNPPLSGITCVRSRFFGMSEILIVIDPDPVCGFVIPMKDGRAHLGNLQLRLNPPEEPITLTLRCGGCMVANTPYPKATFYPRITEEVRLQEAEPLTLTVQRRPFIRGDANLDGSVDISDAITIVHGLFLSGTLACPNAADANDDNAVDISDAVTVAGFLFLGTAPMPPPFPAPGYDPSATFPERTGCTCPIGVHPCL